MFKKDWVKLSDKDRITLMSNAVKSVYAKLSLIPIDFYNEIGVDVIQGIEVTYFFKDYNSKTPIGCYENTEIRIVVDEVAIYYNGSVKTVGAMIDYMCKSVIDNAYHTYNWWLTLDEWLIDDFEIIRKRREENERLKGLFLNRCYLKVKGRSFYGGIGETKIAKVYSIKPSRKFSYNEIVFSGSRQYDTNKMLIVSENQLMLHYKIFYNNEDVVKTFNISLCDETDIEKEVRRQEKLFWDTMKNHFGYDKKKKR